MNGHGTAEKHGKRSGVPPCQASKRSNEWKEGFDILACRPKTVTHSPVSFHTFTSDIGGLASLVLVAFWSRSRKLLYAGPG